jgi:hypothetical protein
MKEERPDLKFGYYSILPNRDYWAPVSADPDRVEEWEAINTRLKRLANEVDVIFPSVYTFYNTPNSWDIYATAIISEAKKYNKPVYAFVWPQYHNSNADLKYTYIDDVFWKRQLDLLSDTD